MRGLLLALVEMLPAMVLAGVALSPTGSEIVVADEVGPVVRFAAKELNGILKEAFGAPLPVVRTRTPGRTAIILGDGPLARAAGIDVAALRRDAARIRVDGDCVFVLGRDSATDDPEQMIFRQPSVQWRPHWYERGTLNGVYEFLERFAGVRFYFPGELGTVVPKTDALELPAADLTVAPAFTVRYYSHGRSGEWFDPVSQQEGDAFRNLNLYRLRMETEHVPCSHGLRYFRYVRRFGASHPEYFRMKEDGTRDIFDSEESPHYRNGRLCLTSGIYDEIYRDVRSYLKGEPAETRGVFGYKDSGPTYAWGINCAANATGHYVDVMPEDGFLPCSCAKCRAAYGEGPSYATELVWGETAKMARKLTEEGIEGNLTLLAYEPFLQVPNADIPTNVKVMVACKGPWACARTNEHARQMADIRAWYGKTGGKVWLWTYPGKFPGFLELPDVPHTTPRSIAKFFGDVAPYIFGAYAESYTDRFLYNYLNLYVFSKFCWNPRTDVKALLAEHDRLMFGVAAKPMGAFFKTIEKKWLYDISGRDASSVIGPLDAPPTDFELWTMIYSPQVFAELDALLRKASAAVPPGSFESRRVALVRREFYDRPKARAADFLGPISVETGRAWRREHPDAASLLGKDGKLVSGDGWTFGGTGATVRYEPVKDLPGISRCACLTTTEEVNEEFLRAYLEHPLDLVPGAKYRVTYFAKLDNVRVCKKRGGMIVAAYDGTGNSHGLPWPGLIGSSGWFFQKHEFTASEDPKPGRSKSLQLRIAHARGTVRFADVVVERVE